MSFFANIYYKLHLDALPIIFENLSYKRACENAIQKFVKNINSDEKDKILKDIKKAYFQCYASPEEYFLLGLANLDAKQRKSFVTDKFLFMTMTLLSDHERHDREIADKWGFFNLAKKYFKRDVIKVETKEDYNLFKNMALKNHHLILKPNYSCMGNGIRIADVETEEEARQVFENMIKNKGSWIVEERLTQSDEMSLWNESSVNTIRVPSFLNKDGFFIITPSFRIGRKGSVVDNAGAGGVLANIDYRTGKIESDGVDEEGKYYKSHPDSGISFYGYQIPKWKELLSFIEDIHKNVMPSHLYIGWDFALTKDRGWCVIEANWGQFINQYNDKKGRKQEFLKYVMAKPYKG